MIDKKNLNIKDKATEMKIYAIIDKINLTILKNITSITTFLTPLELSIVIDICEKNHVKYKVFGGFENATRNKVVFYSFEETFDFNIEIIRIDYNKKFSKNLSHSDFLGSVLGTGIKRELIGDILINEYVYIFVDTAIADYILVNYENVGRTKIKTQLVESAIAIEEKRDIQNLSFSSLRVDTVISAVFNISRNTSKELIEKERVFKNYAIVNDCTKNIKEGDIISVRSYGKFQFIQETGTSKKGKIRGDVSIYS